MYCKKCGKFIGTDAEVCDECKQKESVNASTQQAQYQQAQYQQPQYQQPLYKTQNNDSAINLGKAIAGVILSFIGFIFGLTVLEGYSDTALVIGGLLLGLAPCIIGLVFGIKSISNFKETSYIKSGKRIPTLIMGIASTAQAGLGLLFFFLALIGAL